MFLVWLDARPRLPLARQQPYLPLCACRSLLAVQEHPNNRKKGFQMTPSGREGIRCPRSLARLDSLPAPVGASGSGPTWNLRLKTKNYWIAENIARGSFNDDEAAADGRGCTRTAATARERMSPRGGRAIRRVKGAANQLLVCWTATAGPDPECVEEQPARNHHRRRHRSRREHPRRPQ